MLHALEDEVGAVGIALLHAVQPRPHVVLLAYPLLGPFDRDRVIARVGFHPILVIGRPLAQRLLADLRHPDDLTEEVDDQLGPRQRRQIAVPPARATVLKFQISLASLSLAASGLARPPPLLPSFYAASAIRLAGNRHPAFAGARSLNVIAAGPGPPDVGQGYACGGRRGSWRLSPGRYRRFHPKTSRPSRSISRKPIARGGHRRRDPSRTASEGLEARSLTSFRADVPRSVSPGHRRRPGLRSRRTVLDRRIGTPTLAG